MRLWFLALISALLLCSAPARAQSITTVHPVLGGPATLGAASASCLSTNCVSINLGGYTAVSVQLVGACGTCTAQFEVTVDGTNWVAVSLAPPGTGVAVTSTTTAGIWQGSVVGRAFRVRLSAWASSSFVASIRATMLLSRYTGSGGTSYFGDGTAAAPSIAFAAEPGSGLYRVGTGNVSLQVLGVSRFNADSVTSFMRGPDGGAYFFVINGGVSVNSAYLAMANGGTQKFQFQAATATDGQAAVANGNGTTGVGLDVATADVLTLNNKAQTARGTLKTGSIYAEGLNVQSVALLQLSELTTIAAAATTDTTIQMPAGAIVLAVNVRVTVAIPTAATFTVGDSGSAARFSTAAVAVAANSTDPGTKAGAYYNAGALAIRITPNLTPGANTGRVRVTIYYFLSTPPAS